MVKPAWHEAFEPGVLQYPPALPALPTTAFHLWWVSARPPPR